MSLCLKPSSVQTADSHTRLYRAQRPQSSLLNRPTFSLVLGMPESPSKAAVPPPAWPAACRLYSHQPPVPHTPASGGRGPPPVDKLELDRGRGITLWPRMGRGYGHAFHAFRARIMRLIFFKYPGIWLGGSMPVARGLLTCMNNLSESRSFPHLHQPSFEPCITAREKLKRDNIASTNQQRVGMDHPMQAIRTPRSPRPAHGQKRPGAGKKGHQGPMSCIRHGGPGFSRPVSVN